MALSDAELDAIHEAVWREWEEADKPEAIPPVRARALRAVADAAVADFAQEVMAS